VVSARPFRQRPIDGYARLAQPLLAEDPLQGQRILDLIQGILVPSIDDTELLEKPAEVEGRPFDQCEVRIVGLLQMDLAVIMDMGRRLQFGERIEIRLKIELQPAKEGIGALPRSILVPVVDDQIAGDADFGI